MARYSNLEDTDFFRGVIDYPTGRQSCYSPYSTIAAAKTQCRNAQKWQQEIYPATVQQLVAVLDPDDLIAVLEWQDVAKLENGKWINV